MNFGWKILLEKVSLSKTTLRNTCKLAADTVLHQKVMNVLVGHVCALRKIQTIEIFVQDTTSRNNRRGHR